MSHRVIRKSKVAGVQEARVLVENILLAEVLQRSDTLWLVSPWISDISVFDNRGDGFSSFFPGAGERQIRLSEVIHQLAFAGSTIVIALRPDDINAPFLRAIEDGRASDTRILVRTSADLHEKTLAGDDFVISGSMNFTVAGLDHNEEQVRLDLDPEVVSSARRDLRSRWGPDEGSAA